MEYVLSEISSTVLWYVLISTDLPTHLNLASCVRHDPPRWTGSVWTILHPHEDYAQTCC